MRRQIIAAVGAVVVAGGLAIAGSTAEAADCATTPGTSCDVSLSAVVGGSGLTGVRTLGTVAPVALAGTGSLTGVLAVPVIETAAAGDAAWSVTAQATGALTSGGNSIPASNLSVASTALPTGVGCLSSALLAGQQCTVSAGASGALNSTQTLFSVSGESTSTAYTGTYAYTGALTLNVPNGTPAGTYSGALTLTLVQ